MMLSSMWFLPLSWIGWVYSLVALIWLAAATIEDFRYQRVPNTAWQVLPFFFAGLFRLLESVSHEGYGLEIALAAIVVVLASERRRLRKIPSLLSAIVAGGVLSVCLLTASEIGLIGVLAVLVWWISWEWRQMGGADAMALITVTLLWPGLLWLICFAASGLVWSLAYRILKGGWLKGHPVPALGIVFTASGIYIIAQIISAAGWIA